MSRHCGICGKPLERWQKAGCSRAHGNQMQSAALIRHLGERCCSVCGKPLTKRRTESWPRFAARLSCSHVCGATWSAGKRAVAISRAALRRGLKAQPWLVAGTWA